MHPDPAFRHEDRAVLESLLAEIGFGMVFMTTPDGPRVAHTPLLSTGDGAVQFHLARGNALTRQIDGGTALIVVNGPDAYVSPRWYANRAQVPTWNYVALELEGRVREMDADGLHGLLDTLTLRNEARLGEDGRWNLKDMPESDLRAMMSHIAGFEMEVLAWRPTFKLSQNKSPDERARVIDGLEEQGALALAQLMRAFAA
jgi:transcriptional regulator